MPLRVALLIAALTLSSSSALRAQDAGCDPSEELGPIEVMPSSGASGVRQNSFVRVRYSKAYFEGETTPTETITLRLEGNPVAGRTQLVGDDTLYFIPDAPLAPNVLYEGTASGAVFPFDFNFRTSAGVDSANPDLRAPSEDAAFRISSSPNDAACTDESGRRIRLEFSSASDDGPRSSVEYWVYLTRAEGLVAPRLLARVRDYGEEVTTVGAILSSTEASRAACISVVAVDGLERSSAWRKAACFDPQVGTGFEPLCAVGQTVGRRGRTSPISTLSVLLAIVLFVRRRSRALTRASRS